MTTGFTMRGVGWFHRIWILFPLLLLAGTLGYYLGTAALLDHVESSILSDGHYLKSGIPLYRMTPEIVRDCPTYGPLMYALVGGIDQLVGSSIVGGKAVAALLLLGSLVCTGIAIRNSLPRDAAWMVVAAGILWLLQLGFFAVSVRTDGLLLMAGGIGLCAVTAASRTGAGVLLGLALAVAMNAKLHGAIFLLPQMMMVFRRQGGVGVALGLCLGIGGAALPFLLFPHLFVWESYQQWLQMVADRPASWNCLEPSVVYLGLAVIPLVFLTWKTKLPREILEFLAALAVAIGVLIYPAAKDGAGPNQFYPLMPLFCWLAAEFIRVRKLQHVAWGVRVRQGLAVWWIISALLASTLILTYAEQLHRVQADAAIVELRDWRLKEGADIQMAIGSGQGLFLNNLRVILVFDGSVQALNFTALTEYATAQKLPPAGNLQEIAEGRHVKWLLPHGDDPFSVAIFSAAKNQFTPAFPSSWCQAFLENYQKVASGRFYDLWIYRGAIQ